MELKLEGIECDVVQAMVTVRVNEEQVEWRANRNYYSLEKLTKTIISQGKTSDLL